MMHRLVPVACYSLRRRPEGPRAAAALSSQPARSLSAIRQEISCRGRLQRPFVIAGELSPLTRTGGNPRALFKCVVATVLSRLCWLRRRLWMRNERPGTCSDTSSGRAGRFCVVRADDWDRTLRSVCLLGLCCG